jgi:hypothetical protein
MQGPNGKLQTMQLQKQQNAVGWWSPDGAMNTVEKAQRSNAY